MQVRYQAALRPDFDKSNLAKTTGERCSPIKKRVGVVAERAIGLLRGFIA